MYASRPAAFVLVSTDHGMMIVNQRDWEQVDGGVIGVSVELSNFSHYDDAQLELLCKILEMRRETYGDGVIVVDGGANIGCYTLEFARLMTGWGQVFSFEPQERIFYALAGNVVLNNCFNARVMLAALGEVSGRTYAPFIDYTVPRNFGGVELTGVREGQEVQLIAIDNLNLARLDLLKLDIEGMELMALRGAEKTLDRCKPVLCIEHIKIGIDVLKTRLAPFGYTMQMTGMNVVAFHESDPVGKRINWFDSKAA